MRTSFQKGAGVQQHKHHRADCRFALEAMSSVLVCPSIGLQKLSKAPVILGVAGLGLAGKVGIGLRPRREAS